MDETKWFLCEGEGVRVLALALAHQLTPLPEVIVDKLPTWLVSQNKAARDSAQKLIKRLSVTAFLKQILSITSNSLIDSTKTSQDINNIVQWLRDEHIFTYLTENECAGARILHWQDKRLNPSMGSVPLTCQAYQILLTAIFKAYQEQLATAPDYLYFMDEALTTVVTTCVATYFPAFAESDSATSTSSTSHITASSSAISTGSGTAQVFNIHGNPTFVTGTETASPPSRVTAHTSTVSAMSQSLPQAINRTSESRRPTHSKSQGCQYS